MSLVFDDIRSQLCCVLLSRVCWYHGQLHSGTPGPPRGHRAALHPVGFIVGLSYSRIVPITCN